MRLVAVLTLACLATSTASADLAGLEAEHGIVTRSDQVFHVLDVYVKFTEPEDRLLVIWDTEIQLDAKPGAKFFNATLPGG